MQFHIFVDRLYLFFCEVSVQFLSPFIDSVIFVFFWFCFFLVLSFSSSLYILEIKSLSEVHVFDFLPIYKLFLHIIISFPEKKLFSLSPSHLLILDLTSCNLGILLRKSDPRLTWWRFGLTFSSSSCRVSVLVFKSLIHC